MGDTVAVLGAMGRNGRRIARALHDGQSSLVLVGRVQTRLAALADELHGSGVVAGSFEAALQAIAGENINVAVNTFGSFDRIAPHAAAASGTTLVTGAGFGVIATQSAAVRAVERRGPAGPVRVDALAAVASDGRGLGEALPATIIDRIGSKARIPARNSRDWPDFGAQRELNMPEGEADPERLVPIRRTHRSRASNRHGIRLFQIVGGADFVHCAARVAGRSLGPAQLATATIADRTPRTDAPVLGRRATPILGWGARNMVGRQRGRGVVPHGGRHGLHHSRSSRGHPAPA